MIPMLVQFNSQFGSSKIPEDANLNFSRQDGLRLVDAISCKVTEQEMGIYELEMVYPISGAYYNAITVGDVIIASHDRRKDNNQGFLVYKISKPINGRVTVYASHISSLLSELVPMGIEDSGKMEYLWSSLHSESQGMFYFTARNSPYDSTAVTMQNAKVQMGVYSIMDILYGIEGGFLDRNYGDYIFDNNTVYHYEDGGKELNYWLQYGVNITSFKQDLNNEGRTWNCLKGFWLGQDDQNNPVYVESDRIIPNPTDAYSNVKRYKILDLSGSFETAPSVATLNTAVQDYGVKHIRTGIEAIKDSIDLTFIDLKRLSDFDDVSWQLDDIRLCDTVNVSFSLYNVNAKMKINQIVWDVLKDDFIKISLGEAKETISETIRQVANS